VLRFILARSSGRPQAAAMRPRLLLTEPGVGYRFQLPPELAIARKRKQEVEDGS